MCQWRKKTLILTEQTDANDILLALRAAGTAIDADEIRLGALNTPSQADYDAASAALGRQITDARIVVVRSVRTEILTAGGSEC